MDWQRFRKLRADLDRPLVMAHRGSSAFVAENTLAAFQQALKDGADILETDLRFTKDDEIVLVHDESVDRTLNGTGLVRDLSLAEIQQLAARDMPEAECPPTLHHLIELTGAKVPIALELKDPLFSRADYAQKLVDLLQAYDLIDSCFIISFGLERLLTVKKLAPSLAAGWITMSNISPKQPVEFLGPFWPVLLANPLYIYQARKLGKIICPLDPAPDKRMGLYLKWGLDVVLTDDPARTIKVIEAKKAR